MNVETVAESVPDRLFDFALAHWESPAQAWRAGDGPFISITYGALIGRIQAIADRFRAAGVEPGEMVLLISPTRPEWVQADLALQALGAVTVPVFPSLGRDQVEEIAQDAGAARAVAASDEEAAKLPTGMPCWILERGDLLNPTAPPVTPESLETWRKTLPPPRRDRLATVVYTSGTTAHSRGVMLTHGNLLANMEGLDLAAVAYPSMAVQPGDRALAFLPLSHIFERLVHLYFLSHGATQYYSAPHRLVADFPVARPTLLISVPRIYERILAGIRRQAGQGTVTQLAFRRAERVAVTAGYRRAAGKSLPLSWFLFDRLVYRHIREALGGQLRWAISGGAPLSPDLCAFFLGAGVPIAEGYGLTETSPVISVNHADGLVLGTVGEVLPNLEVRLSDDGEILCRGASVMSGYWRRPRDTAEAIEPDGWFHTGDIGIIDGAGHLKIVDRKKDILVLSTGKNVVPAAIEQALVQSPWIEQAMVVGDAEKYVAALLVVDEVEAGLWARREGQDPEFSALIQNPAFQALIDREVERLTAPFAEFERPKRWVILPRTLSEEHGELTPSLKIKRRVVLEHFPDEYRRLYPENR